MTSGYDTETTCGNCRSIVFIREGGYCTLCGAGTAVPSDERVNVVTGLPVRIPADPALLP